MYLRARYLDPGTGRFGNADKDAGRSTDPATLHRYMYVANSPLQWVDWTGYGKNDPKTKPEDPCDRILGKIYRLLEELRTRYQEMAEDTRDLWKLHRSVNNPDADGYSWDQHVDIYNEQQRSLNTNLDWFNRNNCKNKGFRPPRDVYKCTGQTGSLQVPVSIAKHGHWWLAPTAV